MKPMAMPASVDKSAARGVRLFNVSLDSLDRDEWLPFMQAAAAHPDMLFMVAAGNYDRDIDQQPVYPQLSISRT